MIYLLSCKVLINLLEYLCNNFCFFINRQRPASEDKDLQNELLAYEQNNGVIVPMKQPKSNDLISNSENNQCNS